MAINKKTKIVCTLGPATKDYGMIMKLAKAGMDVARLNFSHGTQEEKGEQIKAIRKISQELDKPIAILADMQGPKLRCGEMDGKVEIHSGKKYELSTEATGDQIPMQFDLSPFVKTNEK